MISRAPTRRLPMARQQQPAMGSQQGFAPPRTQMRARGQNPAAFGFGAPAGRYAAGTSPATAANRPDWLPSYRPGQAQPKQPPSQGSPYGGGIGTLGGPYSDPRWSHNGGAWNSGQQPKAQAGGVAFPQGYTYRPPQRGQQPSTMPPPGSNRPPLGIAPIIDGPGFLAPPGYGQPQPTPDWAQEGYRPDPNGPATGGGFMLPPGLGGPAIGGDAYGPGTAPGGEPMMEIGGSGWHAINPWANPPSQPPFRSEMKDQFGNPTTPEQFYPQQQAMIGRMYDQFKKMDTGVYLGQGAPPPSWGQAKPLDIPSLWNQAGKDVQAGWQNPYMPGNAQPMQPPSQGMPYNPMQQRPGIGFEDWDRAGRPGAPLVSTMDSVTFTDASGKQASTSGTFLNSYQDWVRQQGGAGPVTSPAAGLGYTERPMTREEFDSRKKRKSRENDFYVDPYASYEQYLQSGAMGGQNWLPPAPPTLARPNYQF